MHVLDRSLPSHRLSVVYDVYDSTAEVNSAFYPSWPRLRPRAFTCITMCDDSLLYPYFTVYCLLVVPAITGNTGFLV